MPSWGHRVLRWSERNVVPSFVRIGLMRFHSEKVFIFKLLHCRDCGIGDSESPALAKLRPRMPWRCAGRYDPNYPNALRFVESEQHRMLQIGVCTRFVPAQPGSSMAMEHAVRFSVPFPPSKQQHSTCTDAPICV